MKKGNGRIFMYYLVWPFVDFMVLAFILLRFQLYSQTQGEETLIHFCVLMHFDTFGSFQFNMLNNKMLLMSCYMFKKH